MATLQSLPADIIMDILSMLSVKSISRLRCVCKLWHEWFKNPKFIKMHLQYAIQNNRFSVLLDSYMDGCNYTIDFDVTSSSYGITVKTDLPHGMQVITDSCDGLIGLSNSFRYIDKILWNPSTGQHEDISTLNRKEPFFRNSRYGVFYDWNIDDYKLFKIGDNDPGDDNGYEDCSEVWVCRLGSSSWENIGNIPYNTCHTGISVSDQKPLNGIIHWMHRRKVIIVSFNIVKNRTKEIQVPSCYLKDGSYSYKHMKVGVLGKDLYLLINASDKRNIDLWVMKDYGVIDSWTRIFSLSKHETNLVSLRPLHYLNRNREILLHGYIWLEGENSGEDVLVSYDGESGKFTTLDIPCKPKYFRPTTFVASIFPLNSGEFVEATKIPKVDTRHGACKFFSLTVERAKSFCLKWCLPFDLIFFPFG